MTRDKPTRCFYPRMTQYIDYTNTTPNSTITTTKNLYATITCIIQCTIKYTMLYTIYKSVILPWYTLSYLPTKQKHRVNKDTNNNNNVVSMSNWFHGMDTTQPGFPLHPIRFCTYFLLSSNCICTDNDKVDLTPI